MKNDDPRPRFHIPLEGTPSLPHRAFLCMDFLLQNGLSASIHHTFRIASQGKSASEISESGPRFEPSRGLSFY
jgi:hypothetical protein